MILETEFYGGISYLDLLSSASILLISVIIARASTILLQRSLRDKVGKPHLGNIVKIAYYVIIGVGVVSILPTIGIVEPSSLLFAGSIGGIVIGFASQSIFSNLLSGIFLMVERPIKLGDTVNIEEIVGTIEEIRILSTSIRTFDGVYVRMPNEMVFTTKITNYVANVARRFEYVIGIRYSDNAFEAIKIIGEIIEEEPFALKEPAPQIFVDTLGDNSVNIIVRPWAPSSEWYTLKMKLLLKIRMALKENGIDIAFPQRTVWLADDSYKN